ncbi:MAG: MerR family transcriptional regulator [Bdellovibrio sp.]
MKISAFSYPIIIKEELGEIIISAPDWGIFVAVSLPPSGGVSSKLAAQIAFSYVKVVSKIILQAKSKEKNKKPLPKPSRTQDLFNFERVEEKKFSPIEVAKILGMSKNTVRRGMDSGKIPCIKTPGGHRYMSETQLEEFKTSNCTIQDSEPSP